VQFFHQERKTAVSAFLLGSQKAGVVTLGFVHMLHTVKAEIIRLDTNNATY